MPKKKEIVYNHPTLLQVIEMEPELYKPVQQSVFEEDNIRNIASMRILAYLDYLPRRRMKDFLANLTYDEWVDFITIVPVEDRLKRKLIPNAKEIKRWGGFYDAFIEKMKRT